MQLAGTFMAGAQARLLPPSIPYRFFFASGFYHLVAWALVLGVAGQAPGLHGGPGFLLAALHALTLGVLAMTAMGASLQILPVVTGQSVKALWPARLASWLFIPGVGILIGGFAAAYGAAMAVGGILLAAGLGLYASVIVGLLARATGFRVLRWHIWLALAALAALVLIGLAVIFGVMPAGNNAGAAHGTIAVFGFMGLLAMGFSSILVPMLALGNAPPEGRSLFVMALYCGGLVISVIAGLAGQYEAVVFGAGLLLVAALSHVVAMNGVIKKGMKKKLGISFVLIRTSWVFFPVSIAAAAAAVSGVPLPAAFLMAGYLAIFGWLLTFVLGVQQQIMPFLAAMNASRAGNKPPRLSQLARAMPLRIHAVCHFIAFGLVGVGIVTNMETTVQAGAAFGLVGAFAFLWFTIDVYRRMNANK